MRGLAGLLGAIAAMGPTGGAVAVIEPRQRADVLLPPAYLFGDGRFDPAWWLRRGARRNQRERRRDRRRGIR